MTQCGLCITKMNAITYYVTETFWLVGLAFSCVLTWLLGIAAFD